MASAAATIVACSRLSTSRVCPEAHRAPWRSLQVRLRPMGHVCHRRRPTQGRKSPERFLIFLLELRGRRAVCVADARRQYHTRSEREASLELIVLDLLC